MQCRGGSLLRLLLGVADPLESLLGYLESLFEFAAEIRQPIRRHDYVAALAYRAQNVGDTVNPDQRIFKSVSGRIKARGQMWQS
jgi:hypothetical protein